MPKLEHDRFPDEILPPPRRHRSKKRTRSSKRPGYGLLKTQAELAAALGEDVRTIQKWRRKGLIPSLVLGHRTLRFKLDDVLTALSRRQAKPRKFWEVAV
jgi:hypothetical protein